MATSAGSGKEEFSGGSSLEREVDVLRQALGFVQSGLPDTWEFRIEEDSRSGDVAFDARVNLAAPDGTAVTLVVEAKRLVATRDVPVLIEKLRSLIARTGLEGATPMVVARYLPPSTRHRLEREGAAYADATGNLRIEARRPALFLRNVGEDRDPWRGPGRPRGTLKGAPAARVVRALVDYSPPYTVPELVELSGASTGATYRVVKFLEEEDFVQRRRRGPITTVRWRRLIERWSQDSGFLRSDVTQSFLFPRGVERVPEALRAVGDLRYVLSGSLAAQDLSPYAPPRVAMIYVEDTTRAVQRLELRSVDKGANVFLAANSDDVAFVRARTVDGVVMAAPSQIAVDLLSGPGRSPNEGRALLDWMETHESDWRL